MPRKLALKKLKASDLSFFQTYFRRFPAVKQKAFNLDKTLVETRFFPNLEAEIDAADEQRAPVALTFFGPGGAGPHSLMRKILKQQKNWRLNGELVVNPEENPVRYDPLVPEDIAIMEFFGTSMPNAVKVVLLSSNDPKDETTHAAFAARFPSASMTLLTEEDIQSVITTANTPIEHPIRDWLEGELLEGIANGDADAAQQLLSRRRGRGLSASELLRAKTNAEKVGRQGEELLDYHFQQAPPTILARHEWVARVNAVSPFDFKLEFNNGDIKHVDAKSTGGSFSNPIYLSIGEIKHALTSGVPYDICRLYNVTSSSATMRIASDVKGRLAAVIEALAGLPTGVKAESLAFNPDFFDFADRDILIAYPEEEEGE